MPITVPVIDDRRYQQWVDELLAKVPVCTPEWNNFGPGDPGVTLVQLFAHVTESLLYRANLVPERNRLRFLQLLGIPLATASEARGLVTIDNRRAPPVTQTLPAELEVRAGAVSFRTALGLDVLPVEGRVFFKRPLAAPSAELMDYYRLLYASYGQEQPLNPALYETVALDSAVVPLVDLQQDTVDRCLWVALLGRKDAAGSGPDPWQAVREELAGRTLTLGLVPALDPDAVIDPITGEPRPLSLRLTPGGSAEAAEAIAYELPANTGAGVPSGADGRPAPRWRRLQPRTDLDPLTTPGVVQLGLPGAAELDLWRDLDPLEAGVGDLPPSLDDTALAGRVVTWLRLRLVGAARARLLWAGINAVPIVQREWIRNEPLAPGDGSPGQQRRLARAPVLAGTLTVQTRESDGLRTWTRIDDLLAAAPEVPVADPRRPPLDPAAAPPTETRTDVFSVDPESGLLTFGDGLRGRRLPAGAPVYASYAVCRGAAGNVGPGAIDTAPQLPGGFAVANPVRTWGGADAETVADGERQIKRFLQHRDRLVSAADFLAIAWRTPGIEIGRIEVLPAFHPDLAPLEPGAVPGVVTLLAIPRRDPMQRDAPRADRLFLNALCRWLDPRRLITTELIVRGPAYRGVWISVGIEPDPGVATAEVVEAVTARVRAFLSPLPAHPGYAPAATPLLATPAPAPGGGWPLRTAVRARVLLAEVARVPGVTAVVDCLLAGSIGPAAEEVPMTGLELPRVLGLSVVAGEPLDVESLRGNNAAAVDQDTATGDTSLLPVPVLPEGCG